MATVAPTVINLPPKAGTRGAMLYSWTLADGDDGTPIEVPAGLERTVQVRASAYGTAVVVLEGSLIGTSDSLPATADYKTLTDPQGNALSFTADGLETVMEAVRWIRPRVASGAGATSLVVRLLVVWS